MRVTVIDTHCSCHCERRTGERGRGCHDEFAFSKGKKRWCRRRALRRKQKKKNVLRVHQGEFTRK
jgi:hypothetical protein